MDNYIICMDAAGDIPQNIAAENSIEFIPMEYSLGDKMRTSNGCEKNDLLKRFYDGQRHGDLTKTSQISPFIYEEYFRRFLEQGKSVLYLCLSSGLSSTYASAVTAAKNLKEDFDDAEILVIDTLSAAGGIGLLAEKAIANKRQGMTLHQNFDTINSIVPKIRHFFMVNDLMYLKRGGRVGAATAYVGSMLNIKPMLEIDHNGKLEVRSKIRGSSAAMNALFDYFTENYNPALGNLMYICDADAQEPSSELTQKIMSAYPDLIIRQTMLSPIIGAHTGPGLLSVIFFAG